MGVVLFCTDKVLIFLFRQGRTGIWPDDKNYFTCKVIFRKPSTLNTNSILVNWKIFASSSNLNCYGIFPVLNELLWNLCPESWVILNIGLWCVKLNNFSVPCCRCVAWQHPDFFMDELCKWILSHCGLISIKGNLGRQAGRLAAGKQLQGDSKGSMKCRELGVHVRCNTF